MEHRTIGVVGLGLFGFRLAQTLAELGLDVLAVDRDPALVARVKDLVAHAVCLDVSDEAALRESSLPSCDLVVVAIGEEMASSILVTALLHELGVRHIVARAHSDVHAQVLRTVGAERTIDPEDEMGQQLAREIFAPDVHARLRLSTGQEVIEVRAHRSLVGRTIAELGFRQKYRLNIVAIKRPRPVGEREAAKDTWQVIQLPTPTDTIHEGDVLVLIGDAEMVGAFLEL